MWNFGILSITPRVYSVHWSIYVLNVFHNQYYIFQNFACNQVLSVGELKPPYIEYSFSKSNAYFDPEYTWKIGAWSECSRSCLGKLVNLWYM